MGFVRNKIYRLVFDDPAMEGLEVRAKSVPLGTILRLTHLTGQELTSLTAAAQTEAMGEMLDVFATALVSWNLEDEQPDGSTTPVPATREGLETQEFDFVMEIITSWMEALMAVAVPLGKRSPNGGPSPVASLPMEILSPNRVNSLQPG